MAPRSTCSTPPRASTAARTSRAPPRWRNGGPSRSRSRPSTTPSSSTAAPATPRSCRSNGCTATSARARSRTGRRSSCTSWPRARSGLAPRPAPPRRRPPPNREPRVRLVELALLVHPGDRLAAPAANDEPPVRGHDGPMAASGTEDRPLAAFGRPRHRPTGNGKPAKGCRPPMHALVTPDGAADPGGALPGPFGPRTPGTQTAGVAEAIRALVGRQGGGVVEIEPAGSYPLTATLEVPSNITLRSAMGGGEAYGPKIVPPIGALRWNASGGPALLFGPGVTRATLEGIAVIGDTPTALVWRSGCRQVTFRDVCLQNASGPALQSDGARGANTEDCAVERAYLEGAPALQLGAPGETQRSNNCRWVDVT